MLNMFLLHLVSFAALSKNGLSLASLETVTSLVPGPVQGLRVRRLLPPINVSAIILRLRDNAKKALGACHDPSTVEWQQLDIARDNVTKELTSLIKLARRRDSSESDDVHIDTFGSLRSGLADGRISDLDASVMYGGNRNDVEQEQAKKYAEDLTQQLKLLDPQSTNFRVAAVLEARVPLVKLKILMDITEGSVFPIDLSFSSRAPIRNTKWLRWQVERDPRFRPLVLAVKEFAKRIGLHGTYSGTKEGSSGPEKTVGLSSYGWSLLVAFFLHVHPSTGGDTAFLSDFRRYYATFDYEKNIISFPGARVEDHVEADSSSSSPVGISSSGPTERRTWWPDFHKKNQTGPGWCISTFHESKPVLLDPFEENRNLFRYFSSRNNLALLAPGVEPLPPAIDVFRHRLRLVRWVTVDLVRTPSAGASGKNVNVKPDDLGSVGIDIVHPVDPLDPLLSLKLKAFQAAKADPFRNDVKLHISRDSMFPNSADNPPTKVVESMDDLLQTGREAGARLRVAASFESMNKINQTTGNFIRLIKGLRANVFDHREISSIPWIVKTLWSLPWMTENMSRPCPSKWSVNDIDDVRREAIVTLDMLFDAGFFTHDFTMQDSSRRAGFIDAHDVARKLTQLVRDS